MDKIEVKYRSDVFYKFTVYSPKSKSLLIKNIITNSCFFILISFVDFLMCYLYNSFYEIATEKTKLLLIFGLLLSVFFIAMLVYSTYLEWKNGLNFDYAIKLLKEGLVKSEYEEPLHEFINNGIYRKVVDEDEKTD